MVVVGVERDTVVHQRTHTDVANLERSRVAYQNTKSVDKCVVAYTLNGDIQFAVGSITFHLQALCRTAQCVHIGGIHHSDDAEAERSSVLSFLVRIDDSLHTGASGLRTFLVGDDIGRDSLRCICRHIEHLCARLERTVVLVGTDAVVALVEMRIAVAVEGGGGQHATLGRLCSHLGIVCVHGDNFQLILARFQSHSVHTAVSAVVTQQILVKLSVRTALGTHISVIIGVTAQRGPFGIDALEPTGFATDTDGRRSAAYS